MTLRKALKAAGYKPLSEGEEALARHMTEYNIPFSRQFKICDERNWTSDFYINCEPLPILIEVEGGTAFGLSRHSKGDGYENDCRKYNTAILLGFRLLRFTTKQVKSGHAIDIIRGALT
jgi:very-short-patch-repair endonuclease